MEESEDAAIVKAIVAGDVQGVKDLLDNGFDIQKRFLYREYPTFPSQHKPNTLELACCLGQNSIVDLLIGRGVDVNAEGGFYTALQFGVLRGHLPVVTSLINAGADLNAKRGTGLYGHYEKDNFAYTNDGYPDGSIFHVEPDVEDQVALSIAIKDGEPQMVKLLLDQGAETYPRALKDSIARGIYEIVQAVLGPVQDGTPNVQIQREENIDIVTSLIFSEHSNASLLKLLLDRGADTYSNRVGNAVIFAAQEGKLDMLNLILERTGRSLVNVRDAIGRVALHPATAKGYTGIVKALIDHGARGDIPDFNGATAFEMALKRLGHNHELTRILYPVSKGKVLSAKEWGDILKLGFDECLEFTEEKFMKTRVVNGREIYCPFPGDRTLEFDHSLLGKTGISRKSIIVIRNQHYIKRALTGLHRRWWRQHQSTSIDPNLPGINSWALLPRTTSLTSRMTLVESDLQKVFLESYFALQVLVVPRDETVQWPTPAEMLSSDDKKIDRLWKTHIIGWLMFKKAGLISGGDEPFPLESKKFISTTEYAQLPAFASNLFVPLVATLKREWEVNFRLAEAHVSVMVKLPAHLSAGLLLKKMQLKQTKVLKASGEDSNIIRELLSDALLFGMMRKSAASHIRDLENLRDAYNGEQDWLIVEDSERNTLQSNRDEFDHSLLDLSNTLKAGNASLKELSAELIQLEFNLTSISEAQKSRSTNLSMKRLSWITFIFLPLTFISSVFGMNIDVLASNPAWWIYLPFASGTLSLTILVWLIFKYNHDLEQRIEGLFEGVLFFLSRKKRSISTA